jgi:hypothetical protein
MVANVLRPVVFAGTLMVGLQLDLSGQRDSSGERDRTTILRLREEIQRASPIRVYTATEHFIIRLPVVDDSVIMGEGAVVPLRDLSKVQRRGSAWSKGALVGSLAGGVGGAIGGGVAAANFCAGGCTNQGAGAALGGLAGAVAGGLLGAMVGSAFHRWHTIYDRSRRPAPPPEHHLPGSHPI